MTLHCAARTHGTVIGNVFPGGVANLAVGGSPETVPCAVAHVSQVPALPPRTFDLTGEAR